MIQQNPEKPADTDNYHRTKSQKKREYWGDRGDSKRGYERSAIDADEIIYPEGSKKI